MLVALAVSPPLPLALLAPFAFWFFVVPFPLPLMSASASIGQALGHKLIDRVCEYISASKQEGVRETTVSSCPAEGRRMQSYMLQQRLCCAAGG